jgi:hypothetical protein
LAALLFSDAIDVNEIGVNEGLNIVEEGDGDYNYYK